MPRVIPPAPGRDDEFFWAGVAEGRLRARRCAGCGYLQHPPSPMCPRCGSVDWDVADLAGTGSVYSWISSRHPSQPDEAARVVALTDLDEGIRMVSNLQGIDVADVHPGLRVRVTFRDFDGVTLPQFTPEAAGSGDMRRPRAVRMGRASRDGAASRGYGDRRSGADGVLQGLRAQ